MLAFSPVDHKVVDIAVRGNDRVFDVFNNEQIEVNHKNMVSLDCPSLKFAAIASLI
jgi:hypothetical protein